MNIPCRICLQFENDEKALRDQIEKYIRSLDPEVKVQEDEYAMRLAVCEQCSSLSGGLCKYCGCFVAVRAIKKIMSCPNPSGERW